MPFISGLQSKRNFSIDEKYGSCIRWNDFWGIPTTIKFGGRNANERIIGSLLFNEANKIGIKLILRGHQDSKYNTKLIKENTFYDGFANIDTFENTHGNKECDGATHSIYLYKRINNFAYLSINRKDYRTMPPAFQNILPVITISTNTDTGRDLIKDSFAMIVFNDDTVLGYNGNGCKPFVIKNNNFVGGIKHKYLKYVNKNKQYC